MKENQPGKYSMDSLQRVSLSLMALLILLTFVATNLQAVLWQSSGWLVSTVLPAVVVDLTNEERIDNNRAPLVRNTALDEAARLKAKHMAKNEYFAHFAPDGTSPWHWFDEAGYVYAHAGENLAIHFTDSDEVVEAWMNSPLHRENIVNGNFTQIGVGTAKGKFDGYDTVYVVQLFGAPGMVSPAVAVAPTPISAPETVEVTPAPIEIAQAETEPVRVLAAEDSTLTPEEAEPVLLAEVEPVQSETVMPEESANPNTPTNEVLVIEHSLISTSSGLTVASLEEEISTAAESGVTAIATRPHLVLNIIYISIAVVVLALLLISFFRETRRHHLIQMSYSLGLLIAMVGLWYLHDFLTSGAVIV